MARAVQNQGFRQARLATRFRKLLGYRGQMPRRRSRGWEKPAFLSLAATSNQKVALIENFVRPFLSAVCSD